MNKDKLRRAAAAFAIAAFCALLGLLSGGTEVRDYFTLGMLGAALVGFVLLIGGLLRE